MKIFLDFDDVIFNTKQFMDDMKNVFEKRGVSREVFEEYYRGKDDSGCIIKEYDFPKHIERIFNAGKIDLNNFNNLKNDMEEFLADTSKYVFSDMKDFLSKYDKNDLYLISHGYGVFQENKIKHSGIFEKFKQAVVTKKIKDEGMASLLEEEGLLNKQGELDVDDIYFVDDRFLQVESVKKRFPKIKAVLIRRDEGRYCNEVNERGVDHEKFYDLEITDFKNFPESNEKQRNCDLLEKLSR